MAATRGRQFGSVRRLTSGKYQASYTADGQRVNAPTTFTTVTDARVFLATVRADLTREAWRAPARVTDTVETYGRRWIAERPNLKASTRHQYETDFRLHVIPYLGSVRLGKLTPDAVRSWQARLAADLAAKLSEQDRQRSATRRDGKATTARAYRLLHSVMTTALDDGLIQVNPCKLKGAGNARSVERPTLTATEAETLAATVPPRYSALVHLLTWTGLRIGEAAALTRRDLQLGESPTVTVRARTYRVAGELTTDEPKSEAGRRTIALPPHLTPILRKHLRQFPAPDLGALVFTTTNGRPITDTYSGVISRALAKIGRPDVRVHDLRHTGMTLAAEAGASLPELRHRLGQSTTRAAEIYLHATADHGRQVAERLSKLRSADNVIPLRRAE